MSREVRLVLAAAAVVAALALAAVLLWRNPPQEAEVGITFRAGALSDLARVTVENAQGVFEIVRSGEGFVAGDMAAELVDVQELGALLNGCAQVQAERLVEAEPRDLALYGLAAPAARVEIDYTDQSKLALRLGAQEPVSGGCFAQVGDGPAVYLLAAERCAGYLQPPKAYIEDLVTPELALSSPLSALLNVTFEGGRLAQPVTVEAVATGDPAVTRAALSFGVPTHIPRGRGVYELDQTYGVEMLGSLLGITATDVVGYGLSQQEIDAFGFARPTMRVGFDLKNGLAAEVAHYELAVLVKGEACYLTCNDNGVIYLVPAPRFLQLEYDRLPVRWFLSPLLIDVRAVEVRTPDQHLECVITGKTNAEKQATCNGQPLDIERFRVLYGLLTSAAHDGRLLPNAAPSGAPLLQVTYRYLDEGKAPDTMTLYRGDARRVYVDVNGVTELAMREMYAVRVQEALGRLWSEEPIETDW